MRPDFFEFLWYCAWFIGVPSLLYGCLGLITIITGLLNPRVTKVTIRTSFWVSWIFVAISTAYIIAFWS